MCYYILINESKVYPQMVALLYYIYIYFPIIKTPSGSLQFSIEIKSTSNTFHHISSNGYL